MNNVDNYRPTAIVPIIEKVFETILKDKLVSFHENKSSIQLNLGLGIIVLQ